MCQKSHPFDTQFCHQRQMSLPPVLCWVSRNADCGPNSGLTMEQLSSTTTQPQRSVTCIIPLSPTASQWGDQRLLLLLTSALRQPHHQQLCLQQQQVAKDGCCWCYFSMVYFRCQMSWWVDPRWWILLLPLHWFDITCNWSSRFLWKSGQHLGRGKSVFFIMIVGMNMYTCI